MIDLSNFSSTELRELQTQVVEQIKTREKDEIANVQKQILALAQSVGMSVEEIMDSKGSKTKKATKTVAVRYRHPEQPELQWTGRGRQPRWIVEYLQQADKTLESLLVD